jgi:hypothetical protein
LRARCYWTQFLGYVLWERHTPASDAAGILSAPLASRLRNAFHPRLGGQWDIEREGPLKEWRDGLMNVRHRVVHAGYHPDEWAARRAVAAFIGLEEFLANRVLANRTTYPRLTLLMVGIPGLERRRLFSARMRRWLADIDEDPDAWARHYASWRQSLQVDQSGTAIA